MFKGELLIAKRDRAGAATVLERVIAAQPSAAIARYLLVSTYVQGNELAKADAQIDELKKVAPADPRTQHAIAMVALARDDVPNALEAVRKALQAAPDYLPAMYLSGLIDLKRGSNASAEQSLRKVVSKLPMDNGARIALAQAVLRLGQPAKAREILDPVLRRAPDEIGAMRLAGEVELALRNPDRAASYVQRANAIDESIDGRVRLAQIRLAKGDNDEGIRELETLSASDRGQAAARLRSRRSAPACEAIYGGADSGRCAHQEAAQESGWLHHQGHGLRRQGRCEACARALRQSADVRRGLCACADEPRLARRARRQLHGCQAPLSSRCW